MTDEEYKQIRKIINEQSLIDWIKEDEERLIRLKLFDELTGGFDPSGGIIVKIDGE